MDKPDHGCSGCPGCAPFCALEAIFTAPLLFASRTILHAASCCAFTSSGHRPCVCPGDKHSLTCSAGNGAPLAQPADGVAARAHRIRHQPAHVEAHPGAGLLPDPGALPGHLWRAKAHRGLRGAPLCTKPLLWFNRPPCTCSHALAVLEAEYVCKCISRFCPGIRACMGVVKACPMQQGPAADR